MWHVSQTALSQIDREIEDLRGTASGAVTVGALTYFSSRWLSPRLTRLFEANPGISLRIEPINSVDMMRSVKVDMAILWGIDGWEGHKSELLLSLPAVPTASRAVAEQVSSLVGRGGQAASAFGDSSGDAGWRAWHKAAGLPYAPSRSSLTIPDSNSRVQAVVDGQGIALWDDLVAPEFGDGTLVRLSDVRVENAGYFVVFTDQPMSQEAEAFLGWLRFETATRSQSESAVADSDGAAQFGLSMK